MKRNERILSNYVNTIQLYIGNGKGNEHETFFRTTDEISDTHQSKRENEIKITDGQG